MDQILDRAWRNGVSAEDRGPLGALLASATARSGELRTLAAFAELMAGIAAEPPPVVTGFALVACASRAARAWAFARAGAAEPATAELAALDTELAAARRDPRAQVARAFADIALADIAMMTGDRSTARRRWTTVINGDGPIAFRIHANLKLATAAIGPDDLPRARLHADHAVARASAAHRAGQAHDARVAAAVLAMIAGDRAAAHRHLAPLAAEHDVFAELLLSATEPADRAMPRLAEALAAAAERGDPIAYLAIAVSGARRYAALGRDADALLTLTAAATQMDRAGIELGRLARDERAALRKAWGEQRWAAAETAALAILAEQP